MKQAEIKTECVSVEEMVPLFINFSNLTKGNFVSYVCFCIAMTLLVIHCRVTSIR